ncbi:MAG: iron-containing alcohol dehydrogenase, partial [Deltaproteobacteria bacterium]|nr:iron-containing alcohol dehydrogenase [Deltaproteobacteria bacterium]
GVIQAMLEFGKRAVDNGADMEARTHIQWASIVALNGWIQAGMRKRFPVHTIEHAVSAFYDIPHGAGLSILNPAWMKFSMKEIRKKLCLMGSRIFNIRESETSSEENAFKALAAFRNYLETIGAPLNLSRFGIGRDKFNEIAGDIVGTSGDRGGKIPGRPDLSKEDIISILEESL